MAIIKESKEDKAYMKFNMDLERLIADFLNLELSKGMIEMTPENIEILMEKLMTNENIHKMMFRLNFVIVQLEMEKYIIIDKIARMGTMTSVKEFLKPKEPSKDDLKYIG